MVGTDLRTIQLTAAEVLVVLSALNGMNYLSNVAAIGVLDEAEYAQVAAEADNFQKVRRRILEQL